MADQFKSWFDSLPVDINRARIAALNNENPSAVIDPRQEGPMPKSDFLPYTHPGQSMDEPGSVGYEITRNVRGDLMGKKWRGRGMTPGQVAGLSSAGPRIDPAVMAKIAELLRNR